MMFDTSTSGHRTAAERVGPFATRDFLATVWRHTAAPGQAPLILSDERGEVVLVEEGDHLGLLGHEDLVDYRSPLGDAVDLLVELYGRRLMPTRAAIGCRGLAVNHSVELIATVEFDGGSVAPPLARDGTVLD